MEPVRICNYAPYMYSHSFYFFSVFRSHIYENIVNTWRLFLSFITCVNCRPSENSFNNSIFGMNVYNLGRSYLVITSTITNNIYKSVITDVVHIPRNFICMSFYNYAKWSVRINDSYGCSVSIGNKFIYIWF